MSKKDKRVLVTGGLGFIGSKLSERLSQDCHVTVVDNLSSSREDFVDVMKQNEDIEYVISCFSSEEIIDRLRDREFDVVFHVAAIPRVAYSVAEPYKTTDVNIAKTVNFLKACADGKVSRIVFSSSSSVYGGAEELPTPVDYKKNPKSPYAWQKSAIEDFTRIMCDLYEGTDVVCLRYFNVFGPGQFGGSPYSTAISAWCDAIKNKKQLRKDGTGEQSRDFSYIDNVVDANILAMKCDKKFVGECYNIACGDKISNNQILERFEEKFGDLDMRQAPFRPGDVMHTQADISKTSLDLGYKPTVKFWEGLERTFEWWKL